MLSIDNPELDLAFNFVQFTNRHIFLTGKAGTGKTTFLHNLKKTAPKRMIVVAPTGVAAINAGGVTIHSFFQLPFHPHIPHQYINEKNNSSSENPSYKIGREKINIIKSLDLLIIDEISMVRADLLDAIDLVLRRYKNRNLPFGGVQLLMIGDIQQLPPVVKDEEWKVLSNFYETAFFFNSLALKNTEYVTIELKHIYRQQDQKFINLLNKIRDNKISFNELAVLNERYDPKANTDIKEGYIFLTTHNAQAANINDSRLNSLPGKSWVFEAIINGEFPEYSYPTARELVFKTGAQVMFVKNDISKDKLFYNGKIGKIIGFEDEGVIVKCPHDNYNIEVKMAEWQNVKFSLNNDTKEIEETVIGTFCQFPLKLAWAITIHKSQGLTFEKAIIDAASAFAHGQVYVALSRCRNIEGLILSSRVNQNCLITDHNVSYFEKESKKYEANNENLSESKRIYQHAIIKELFDFNYILNLLYSLKRTLNEHKESIVDYRSDSFEEIISQFKNEIVNVSEKFYLQVNNLITLNPELELNDQLQERVNKACTYFTDKLSLFIQTILNFNFPSDNKKIQKSLNDSFKSIGKESEIKLVCLKKMKTGFSVGYYLNTKARASIEVDKHKNLKEKYETDGSDDIKNKSLLGRLRQWRDNYAIKLNLPAYMILQQRTMVNISNILPPDLFSLKKIKGIGKSKAEKYGNEILEIIKVYCEEMKIDQPVSTLKNRSPEKKQKPDTKSISFGLFKSGKSVLEIATERNMKPETVEEHLAHFVGLGELSVNEFVSPEIVSAISEQFDKNGSYKLGPVKSVLGNQVSWSDIKFVAKHFQFINGYIDNSHN